jgi:predicted Fe-Mo cluster-binding NifX family protein
MKIALATDDKGKTIASHFGRTKGFIIFIVKGSTIESQEYRENSFTGHARELEHSNHNIDRHGPILNALNDCNTVISNGMGRRIYEDLINSGIQALITDETNVKSAMNAFIKGELKDIPERGCSHK